MLSALRLRPWCCLILIGSALSSLPAADITKNHLATQYFVSRMAVDGNDLVLDALGGVSMRLGSQMIPLHKGDHLVIPCGTSVSFLERHSGIAFTFAKGTLDITATVTRSDFGDSNLQESLTVPAPGTSTRSSITINGTDVAIPAK